MVLYTHARSIELLYLPPEAHVYKRAIYLFLFDFVGEINFKILIYFVKRKQHEFTPQFNLCIFMSNQLKLHTYMHTSYVM